MIEEKMETTLYAPKVFDNQRWNVDKGLTRSKIFFSNQTYKQAITSGLQCRRDAVKSKALSLSFFLLKKTSIVVDDDITCPSCI
jgi:hypothetical protein